MGEVRCKGVRCKGAFPFWIQKKTKRECPFLCGRRRTMDGLALWVQKGNIKCFDIPFMKCILSFVGSAEFSVFLIFAVWLVGNRPLNQVLRQCRIQVVFTEGWLV